MEQSLEAERYTAIHLLRSDQTPQEVAQKLGRCRSWVYKWRQRFHQQGAWEALRDRSRAPRHSPNRLAESVRAAIRQARSELEAEATQPDQLSYIGAPTVQVRLRKKGVQPLPSLSSIERELRRTGMTRPRIPPPAEVDYPHLHSTQPQQLVQVDIVPHYLPGGTCVSCFHALDVVSRYPVGGQSATKRSQDAAAFLLQAWRELGVPDYTQVDNEGCFSGGFTHPYVLGKVLHLALLVGTELVYSPFYHPQSNGAVERFHQEYHRHVWDKHTLCDLSAVQKHSPPFFERYRHEHYPLLLHGQCPAEAHGSTFRRPLPANFRLPARLPLTVGSVHFIRQVNEPHKVRILNVDWEVPLAQPRQGVWATLELTLQGAHLRLYDAAPDAPQRRCLASHPFPLQEPVQPLDPCFQKDHAAPLRSWFPSAIHRMAQYLPTGITRWVSTMS